VSGHRKYGLSDRTDTRAEATPKVLKISSEKVEKRAASAWKVLSIFLENSKKGLGFRV
jgi:hypothetical protein